MPSVSPEALAVQLAKAAHECSPTAVLLKTARVAAKAAGHAPPAKAKAKPKPKAKRRRGYYR